MGRHIRVHLRLDGVAAGGGVGFGMVESSCGALSTNELALLLHGLSKCDWSQEGQRRGFPYRLPLRLS